MSESSWLTWWLLHRTQWLPDRDEARRRAPVTEEAPLGQVGPAVGGSKDGLEQRRDAAAQKAALPLLRRLAAAVTANGDVRASALLALAKLDNGAETQALLRAALCDARAPDMVRESAGLALGLLRRTEPSRRLPAGPLLDVRHALLEVVDDPRAPDRTRAFCAFALGLLGDQPFAASAEQEGRVLALSLWSRLARPEASREQSTALLTALSLQAGAQVPDEVREGLRALVVGRPVLGRRWTDAERSHALSALARLWPAGTCRDLLRVLARARESVEVLRAAALAVGAYADEWSDDERFEAYPLVVKAMDGAKDPWTRGLLRLAVGRLLAADLDGGSARVEMAGAPKLLLGEARKAQNDERGYAVLAVALAGRAAARHAPAPAWLKEVEALALDGLTRVGEDDGVRASYAVALGLLGAEGAVAPLEQALDERDLGPRSRSAGAVALGQIGVKRPDVVRALVLTLLDHRQADLRGEAALALSWLGNREALPLLLREAKDPRAPEHVLAEVSVALGRLGSLGAVDTLVEIAKDEQHGDVGRALAVVALGLVLDPEPRPSLQRLALDANYPARTPALHELLTIL